MKSVTKEAEGLVQQNTALQLALPAEQCASVDRGCVTGQPDSDVTY